MAKNLESVCKEANQRFENLNLPYLWAFYLTEDDGSEYWNLWDTISGDPINSTRSMEDVLSITAELTGENS